MAQIQMNENDIFQEYRQPDETYKINANDVSGKIDKIESVKQAIFHILSTERYSNPIYDDNYGVELEQYIGKDMGYIIADIETTLSEALLQDDRITGVKVNDIKQLDSSSCIINFNVYTIYGNIEEETNVIF